MPRLRETEEIKKAFGAHRDDGRIEIAECADQFEIFEAGQVGIELCFFGHVAESALVFDEVVANAATEVQHLTTARFHQPGDHFHSGALAGTVRAKVAENLPWLQAKANVADCRDPGKALGERSGFEHGGLESHSLLFVPAGGGVIVVCANDHSRKIGSHTDGVAKSYAASGRNSVQ